MSVNGNDNNNDGGPRKSLEEIKAAARAYALGETSGSGTTTTARLKYTFKNSSSISRVQQQQQQQYAAVTAAYPVAAALPLPPAAMDDMPHLQEFDDDYTHFRQMLNLDEGTNLSYLLDDDEDEFQFDLETEDDDEDDDDEADDDDGDAKMPASPPPMKQNDPLSPLPALDTDEFQRELQEELKLLEEEDMEAAVATLLEHPAETSTMAANGGENSNLRKADSPSKGGSTTVKPGRPTNAVALGMMKKTEPQIPSEPACTPIRAAARISHRVLPTQEQQETLRTLLEKHQQLLLQQAVLAVRAANSHVRRRIIEGPTPQTAPEFVNGGESGDDLAEVLDSAVGMLQDLEQNRKDAIRSEIQLTPASSIRGNNNPMATPRRSLLFGAAVEPDATADNDGGTNNDDGGGRRLTRAQFTKALLEQNNGQARTVFDIQGLSMLSSTFRLIDASVDGVNRGNTNILYLETNANACEYVLTQCEAPKDDDLIPGRHDLSSYFCDIREYFGPDFKPPCNSTQQMMLKRNRNLFTSGEDNLVLRGVNLYGEKQWILLSDRFLPERSVNIISQRYGTLCYMLYKTRGVQIDEDGELTEPPRPDSVDDLDMEKVEKLEKVPPPAIINVHRWSMDEDLALLHAVPLFGTMWAEISVRLLPHRDRGHIRKRYQVLQRRVKATVNRIKKQAKVINSKLAKTAVKASFRPTTAPRPPRRLPAKRPPAPPEALPLPPKRKAPPVKHSALTRPDGAPVGAMPQYAVQAAGSPSPQVPGHPHPQAAGVSPSGQAPMHPPGPPVYAYPPQPYAVHHGYPMYQAPHGYPPQTGYQPPPGYQPQPYYQGMYVPIGYAPVQQQQQQQQSQPQQQQPPQPQQPQPPQQHQQQHPQPQQPPQQPQQQHDVDESSRVAFEKLAQDNSTNGVWSPIQHEQHLDNETEAANTIAAMASAANQPTTAGENPANCSRTQNHQSPVQNQAAQSQQKSVSANFDSPDKSSRALPHAGTTPIGLFSPAGLSLASTLNASDNLAASHAGNTMDGFDLRAAFSTIEGTTDEGDNHAAQRSETPPDKSLFGEGATLMENDLEAISALNSLSRSGGSATQTLVPDEKSRPSRASNKRKSNPGQSLFAKVVGGAKEKTQTRSSKRNKRG